MNNRITTSTMYGALLSSLQKNQASLTELQKQIATGNKYTRLSDNPTAISRSLNLKSSMDANDKYYENSQNGITMLRYADAALNNVYDCLAEIRTLVIHAGNGSYDEAELKDIVDAIEAQKNIMLDNLNSQVAGQYIFGGTDTGTRPFGQTSDGKVVYNGNNTRMKYAIADGNLGDVSFTGSEIIPDSEDSYFICSHYVPLDWQWTGREEKVQITVGNRTLSVFIPEDWIDEIASGSTNYTDYNRFRDPGEVSGISLDDIATLVNRSLSEQGASMLVSASVEKDLISGQQQLIIKSNTNEKIGITGWSDTDYLPMAQSLVGQEIEDLPDWNGENENDTREIKPSTIMGYKNVLDWKGSDESGTLAIYVDYVDYVDYNLSDFSSITELINRINADMPVNDDNSPVASLSSGRLVLSSTHGEISINANSELFGDNGDAEADITGSTSSLSITIGDDPATDIYINDGDELEDIAEKINSIEGVLARVTADGNKLVVVAQRYGDLPSDRLAVDAGQESLKYPSVKITGYGNALELFEFNSSGEIASEQITRPVDHSHIDVFDYLGMETGMKSVEFATGDTLEVGEGEPLHWRIISGSHSADITLNAGEYTLTELADRIKNAGAGWLDVVVDVFNTDDANQDDDENLILYNDEGGISGVKNGTGTSLDSEAATQRLVVRGYNGEQVLFFDVNEQHYAEKLGMSTAVRTYEYTESTSGTGTQRIYFPSAPCVDDSIGARMRVQMNCGTYYDISINKSDVADPNTGLVDRTKVMQSIVDQVNAQEDDEVMGIIRNVDDTGTIVDGAAMIYFASGEPFTVVDLPFSDPEWSDYSGGLAAQLGIHGGVTSNLKMTNISIRDDQTMDDVGAGVGTIRFSNLAHSVEIDVSEGDSVKNILDRLKTQAGDWLYINYFDPHMGQMDDEGNLGGRNSGDYPIISISSIDGSAVNVIDVEGTLAQEVLGLSTGIQGSTDITDYEWTDENTPAETLTIKVAGYEHTIDLTAMRDVNGDGSITSYDMVQFINARMQDYDVQAELNNEGHLILYSPRGYNIEVEFNEVAADYNFLGDSQAYTYYRGGYALDESASTRRDDGIYNQNFTIRSGSNTMKQNAFGMIDDIAAAVKSGNIDDLENKMLPRIDEMLNNLLTVMSEGGALQTRYTANSERLLTDDLIMSAQYDDLVKIDPADAITQMMMADYNYQANLAIISRIIQPSLLDFLS